MNLMENPPPPPPPKKKKALFGVFENYFKGKTFANLAKNSEISHSRKFILAKIRDKSFADGCLLLEFFCKRKTTLCKFL